MVMPTGFCSSMFHISIFCIRIVFSFLLRLWNNWLNPRYTLAELLDGTIMKQLGEFLIREQVKTKSFTLSNFNSQKWDILERDSGYKVIFKKFEYTPKHTSDLPPFGWEERLERAQADRYIPHLKKIRRARRWIIIDAANNLPNLLSGTLGGHTIRGTTDVAIIDRDVPMYPSSGLRCIFELKKEKAHQGKSQVLASLLMANYHSPQFRSFAVLSDLIDDWHFYWIDGSTIHFFVCELL